MTGVGASDTPSAVLQDLRRSLPTFLVIGAMKSGTTSLYHYLKGHEQVFLPMTKELDFFTAGSNWRRGVDWYAHQFRDADDAPARGEVSPRYAQYPTHAGVPERIAQVLPDVRLVYVVRDPVARIRSHYQHLVITGVEKAPPETALFENPLYLTCSSYALQLERYLEHFPREQILVVTSEALRSDRRATLQQIYRFLGVDPTRLPDVIDTEFYRTAQRPTYPRAVLWARRFAQRHQVRATPVRRLVETRLARPAPYGAAGDGGSTEGQVLSPQVRAQLVERLCGDVTRFCSYMPADFDGWGYL